jgi:hypothetical protein
MKCRFCKRIISSEAKFCPHCGETLELEEDHNDFEEPISLEENPTDFEEHPIQCEKISLEDDDFGEIALDTEEASRGEMERINENYYNHVSNSLDLQVDIIVADKNVPENYYKVVFSKNSEDYKNGIIPNFDVSYKAFAYGNLILSDYRLVPVDKEIWSNLFGKDKNEKEQGGVSGTK